MWLVGALLGALLASHVSHDVLVLGALVGGFIGWLVGRKRKGELVEMARRIATLEAAVAQKAVSATATAAVPQAVPAAAVAQAPPQSEPPPAEAAPTPAPRRRPLPPAAAARTPRPPMQLPPIVERLLHANVVAKVGILVLFIGLAFLVKYAYERVHMPIELRLSAVALGAIALLVLGWRLRAKRAGYALALQGGGIGIL
jgi:uncharacterized membrane protein